VGRNYSVISPAAIDSSEIQSGMEKPAPSTYLHKQLDATGNPLSSLYSRLVGNPSLGITAGLPVTREELSINRAANYRVARWPCGRLALSELGVKVSLHPAQALRTPLERRRGFETGRR